jgi:hypothetical protein
LSAVPILLHQNCTTQRHGAKRHTHPSLLGAGHLTASAPVVEDGRCPVPTVIRLTVGDTPMRAAILERLEPPGHWLGMLRFTDE